MENGERILNYEIKEDTCSITYINMWYLNTMYDQRKGTSFGLTDKETRSKCVD